MPTAQTNGKNLLDVIKRMGPKEFDAFIEQALSARPRPRATTLSAVETKLIRRINRGLSPEFSERYAYLVGRRKKGNLRPEEHQELLQLTHEAEGQDADRAAALLELAKLRHVPVRTLMKQMGIQTPAVAGKRNS
jgi:hypothetical protein